MGRPAGWMRHLTGRSAMRSPGAPSARYEIERLFWKHIANGITSENATEAIGVSQPVGTRWFRHRGGIPLFMSSRAGGTACLPSGSDCNDAGFCRACRARGIAWTMPRWRASSVRLVRAVLPEQIQKHPGTERSAPRIHPLLQPGPPQVRAEGIESTCLQIEGRSNGSISSTISSTIRGRFKS
jgi:hypothetical protein